MDDDAMRKAREAFAKRMGAVSGGYIPSSVTVPVATVQHAPVVSMRKPVEFKLVSQVVKEDVLVKPVEAPVVVKPVKRPYLPDIGEVTRSQVVESIAEPEYEMEPELELEPEPESKLESELELESEPIEEVVDFFEPKPSVIPKNGNGRVFAPVDRESVVVEKHSGHVTATALNRVHSEMVKKDAEEKVEKVVQKKFEKALEEGSRMTFEIVRAEIEKEKERILNSLRLAYRSEAFRNFKKGKCSHEEFELELLRLLREDKKWSK